MMRENPLNRKGKKRPTTLKLLCAFVLLFVILNIIRIGGALDQWQVLMAMGPAVLPLYQVISGTIWAVMGLAAIIGLWIRRQWSFWLTCISGMLFTIWYWLERILLAGSPDANSNLLFSAILTCVILIIFYSMVFLVKEDVFEGRIRF